ncbi:MAG: hypothetical protein SGARI_006183 [Bacillariaceae sp.]
MMLMDDLQLIYTESQKDLLNFMNTPPKPLKKALSSRPRDEYKADNVISTGLGPHYSPGPFDVICARGKHAFQHAGNPTSKLERTIIVSEIVEAVRAKGNGFVRQTEQGEWVECDEVLAREKTGQLFRNSLGTRYKSSVKSKRKRRELHQPVMVETVQDIIFSNRDADQIIKSVSTEVSSGLLSDHDVYERLCHANIQLLRVFKADPTLTSRYVEATR